MEFSNTENSSQQTPSNTEEPNQVQTHTEHHTHSEAKDSSPVQEPAIYPLPKFVVPGNPELTAEEYNTLASQQEKAIKQEIEKEPMISQAFDIKELISEFENQYNFVKKIIYVIEVHNKKTMRKARKDGNCFYRSFIYRLAEILVADKLQLGVKALLKQIPETRKLLVQAGFQELVFEDFEDNWREFLLRIESRQTTAEILPAIFSDKPYFDFLVMYLRFAISAYIRTSPLFESFFEFQDELNNFCSREVEPIDCEADHIQIMALYNLFNVSLRIFYIDNNNKDEPTILSLPECDNNPQVVNDSNYLYLIQMMYRPGHYDLLY